MNTDERRRNLLRAYAAGELSSDSSNRCQALVNIIAKAVSLVPANTSSRTITIMEDLKLVLIGADLLGGRGRGRYFVGNFMGATGFRPELRDRWNQVQHAIAGLYIGFFHNRLVQWYVLWQEKEPQDDRLYAAVFPLGRNLNDSNAGILPVRMRTAIGDESCQ